MRARTKWLVLVLLLIIFQVCVPAIFSTNRVRIARYFSSGSFKDLIWVCIAILMIFSVRALTSFIIPTISAKLSTSALFELRRDLAAHVLKLPQSYFDKISSSDLILRLVNQVQELSTFIGQTSVKAFRDAATVIIVSSYLIYKNIYLFSIALIVIPLIALLMIKVFRRVREIQILTEKSIGKFISNIDEMKTGIRTVKMTGQEKTESERIEASAKSIKSNTFRVMRTHALTPPVIDLSSAFVYMLVAGGGGYMALSDQFDADGASIIAFLIGLVIVFDPVQSYQFFTRLQSSLYCLDSVHSILDIKTEQLTTGKAFKKANDKISVKLEQQIEAVSAITKDNKKSLRVNSKSGKQEALSDLLVLENNYS